MLTSQTILPEVVHHVHGVVPIARQPNRGSSREGLHVLNYSLLPCHSIHYILRKVAPTRYHPPLHPPPTACPMPSGSASLRTLGNSSRMPAVPDWRVHLDISAPIPLLTSIH